VTPISAERVGSGLLRPRPEPDHLALPYETIARSVPCRPAGLDCQPTRIGVYVGPHALAEGATTE